MHQRAQQNYLSNAYNDPSDYMQQRVNIDAGVTNFNNTVNETIAAAAPPVYNYNITQPAPPPQPAPAPPPPPPQKKPDDPYLIGGVQYTGDTTHSYYGPGAIDRQTGKRKTGIRDSWGREIPTQVTDSFGRPINNIMPGRTAGPPRGYG
jgi:hypothetical protein